MITITTAKPIALESLDHLHPFGTARDSTVWPAFNRKLFDLYPQARLLDLGCAGGGLVKSVIDDGGTAVGVEGSDYSANLKRAEWATIPDNLFLADCTEPFQLFDDGEPMRFDCITAWEFLEHIPEASLEAVFDNIKRHLAPGGIFTASIAPRSGPDPEGVIEYHITIASPEWWLDRMAHSGFFVDPGLTRRFDPDWLRGTARTDNEPYSLCAAWRTADNRSEISRSRE